MRTWSGFSLVCAVALVTSALLPGFGCKRAKESAPQEAPAPAPVAEQPAPAPQPPVEEAAPTSAPEVKATAPAMDEVAARLRDVQGNLLGTVERLQALAKVTADESSAEFAQLRRELAQRMKEGEQLMSDWASASRDQREAVQDRVDTFLAQAESKMEEVRAYGGSAKEAYEKTMQKKLDLAAGQLKVLQEEGQAASEDVKQILRTRWEIARDRLAEVRARAGDDWADTKEEMDVAAQQLDDAMPQPAAEQEAEKKE